MLDLAWLTRFRWQLLLDRVVADRRFGTVKMSSLWNRMVCGLHAPAFRSQARQRQRKTFPPNLFHYDPQQNVYICPQDETLHFWTTDTIASA